MATRGLTVSPQGDLLRDGVRFRNIGLNMPSAIQWFVNQPSNTSCAYTPSAEQDAMLDVADYCKAKVLRIKAVPLWPAQLRYGLNGGVAGAATSGDREAHYLKIDAFLAKCQARGIGVIMNMFFRCASFSDLMGQQVRAGWLTSGSATRNFVQTVTQEIVNRYKDHEAVLGWELSNEDNQYFDQPYNGRPQVDISRGTMPSYSTAGDIFSPSDFAGIMTWWYGLIRAIDPNRIVGTGHGPGVYNQPSGANGITTPLREWNLQQLRDNPTNCVGIHWYADHFYLSAGSRGFNSLLAACKQWARSAGRGLYLGEFGNQHRQALTASVSGGVLTVTTSDTVPMDAGDDFCLLGAGASLDGTFVSSTISADRKTLTAPANGKTGSYSGSVAKVQHMTAAKVSRLCDDIITSGVDVALFWTLDTDTLNASLNPYESITIAGNAAQRDALRAANTALGS